MNKTVRNWLENELYWWRDTYDEEEQTPVLNEIIRTLNNKGELTCAQYDEAIFHLWQIAQGRRGHP